MFKSDSSTHIAKYIPSTEDYYTALTDSLEGVKIKDIFRFSEMCGYSMYILTPIDDTEKECYGIQKHDFDTYWNIKSNIEYVFAHIQGIDEAFPYVCITDSVIKRLNNTVPANNQAFTYFLYRTLFPENKSIMEKVRKKIEFEAGYHFFRHLSHTMSFKHQVNFLNFYADMILEVRDVLGKNMPKIGIEIDENGHSANDPIAEKNRQKVLEYFDNIIFRVSIKRGATQEEIEKEVLNTVKLINEKVVDLRLIYSPEIDIKEVEKRAIEVMIPVEHISLFLADQKTGDKKFPYRHDFVGEKLGYGKTENYKHFRKFLKSNYIEGVDYKIIKPCELEECVLTCSNEELSGKEKQKLGGKDKQTDIYILSRITLNKICIDSTKSNAKSLAYSFTQIYKIFQQFLSELIQKVSKDNKERETAKLCVEQRIDILATRKINRKNQKEEANYNKCKKELEDKNNELESSKKKISDSKIIIADIMGKLNHEKQKNAELEMEFEQMSEDFQVNSNIKLQLEKIKKKYSKLKIRHKILKLELNDLSKEKKDIIEEHQKHVASMTEDHKNQIVLITEEHKETIIKMEHLITKNNAEIEKCTELLKEKNTENINLSKTLEKYKEENDILKKLIENSESESDSEEEYKNSESIPEVIKISTPNKESFTTIEPEKDNNPMIGNKSDILQPSKENKENSIQNILKKL